jgi:uncharacterized membrane protein YeiH
MPDVGIPGQTLVLMLDLAGTFVFAISGAMAARENRLDLFGVLVLAYTAGNVGGVTRDVLIGAVPPPAISDWRYVGVSVAAGLLAFWCTPIVSRLRSPVLLLDAGGLGLFAVSGATKALALGLGPIPATLLGMLTGIGGGMARDLLVAEIPSVLRGELYAVAALAGAAVVVAGDALGVSPTAAAIVGAALCIGLRVEAIRRGWQLPRNPRFASPHGNATPTDHSKPS